MKCIALDIYWRLLWLIIRTVSNDPLRRNQLLRIPSSLHASARAEPEIYCAYTVHLWIKRRTESRVCGVCLTFTVADHPGSYPGHQEIELALLKAYEGIGEPCSVSPSQRDSLLELANYLIEERGQPRPEGHYYDVEARARGETAAPGPMPRGAPRFSYYQADRRIRDMCSVEGHSVRAMYVPFMRKPTCSNILLPGTG
jgi:hypothetical protein